MDSPSQLLARPRALALHYHPPSRPPTTIPRFRGRASPPRRLLVLRPVAALGGGGGGGFAEVGELFGRVEAFLYTVADAAVSSEAVVQGGGGAKETAAAAGDWLSGITNSMETVLKVLKDGLSAIHVPYPYGFAIILLTVLVKAATFPLTKKQVESAIAMRSLQPQVKAIQERYAGDQERIQLETARLYKLSGVDPLAGCLPTLVTIPVWIGLYRALSNVANEGLLTEGFFWIPSLAGPTTITARQSGQGISWLFPFTDGHPPLGWSDTLAYLVLPVLLVISQYVSSQVMQPQQNNDPSQQGAQAVVKFLPLLIGYFALSVPSGLSLYWLTNNILSTAQQVWLQKLGGAKNPVKEYIDKLAKEESANVGKFEPAGKSDALPKVSKPQASQEPKPSGPQRGERFRKLKEEESRRKIISEKEEISEKAEQTEQAGTQSGIIDGKQNSDVSAGDNVDKQDIIQESTDSPSSVMNPTSNDNHKSRDEENEQDAV
uniref:Membrane insertase YidC/Oxa/ALB C-terminal domain-containing protein n=1 Tax=Leersia perrieri TaxID=77586 RepID=A0A0D9W1B0_9ORYZ